MKRILILLVIIIFLQAYKQKAVGQSASNKIEIGTIDSMYSPALGEERKIWVHVPDDYNPKSKTKYPVVYLLDGDGHFHSVVGLIQQLSEINGNTVVPEMIVVGIPNTERMRDLTPTHVDVDPPYLDSADAKTSGGGEKFEAFLEKELIPHIDSAYPTNAYKVFIGHSLGGLTVINTVIHHQGVFNAYIAIDPSMWWDHEKLLKEAETALPKMDLSHTSLFLGIANTMEAGMDTLKVQSDTASLYRHIRSILKLSHYLGADAGQNKLRFSYKYYNGDNHGSVPLITEYDGLHFLFDYYKLDITNKEFLSPTKALVDKIVSHYDTVTTRMGFKVLPPEDMINQMAYAMLSLHHADIAEMLAALNTTNYATSANAFDTLGDIYDGEGKKQQAIDSYKKALAIDGSMADTKKKLEKLQGK